MRTPAFFLVPAVLVVSLAACATSEPVRERVDPNSNLLILESEPVRIQTQRRQALGLQGKQLLTLQAQAPCAGNGCQPDAVVLVLTNTSDTEVWLNYRTLSLDADGELFEWDDLVPREEPVRVPPGVFLQVPMDMEDFLRAAHASSVTGAIGDTPFRLEYSDRAPLRALAERIAPSAPSAP